MLARRQQVALALTALLTSAAACQAHGHRPAGPGHPSAGRAGHPAPAAARDFTLVASGDILPQATVVDRARFDAGGAGYDFRPLFEDARPVVSAADLALCHLDTVLGAEDPPTGSPTSGAPAPGSPASGAPAPGSPALGSPTLGSPTLGSPTPGSPTPGAPAPGAPAPASPAPGSPASGSPTPGAPPEIAAALAATGYDSCSTASPHSLDAGADGVRRTLDALDAAGVRHAGTARTEAEGNAVTLLRAGPATVAHLAYTGDTAGHPPPPGQPWAVGLADRDRILADAKAARKAGADVVVVSLHWGTAWQDAPDERQLALARALTASRTGGRPDVDLIVGAGPHVPQAYEKVNGTWVVYGLGDQVAGEMFNGQGLQDARGAQSTVARFTFTRPARPGGRWRVRRAESLPSMFDVDAGRVVDLDRALARGAEVAGVRDRVRAVALSRGAAAAGLVTDGK
ncbi:CapA family protein [Streptomyces sp. NBC_00704]|nr:CapA family protein [Streptomyces sp. NBC_00704]